MLTKRQRQVRQYNQRYYRRHRKKLISQSRRYRKLHIKEIARARETKYQRDKDMILDANRKYRKRNVKAVRKQKRAYRLRKMGLSKDEISRAQSAWDNHDGKCEMCGRRKPGGMGGWLTDHNHRTKTFRGILCNRCNSLLGFADDDLDVFKAAIGYLLRKDL
jgi:hypothetical protein